MMFLPFAKILIKLCEVHRFRLYYTDVQPVDGYLSGLCFKNQRSTPRKCENPLNIYHSTI